MIVQSVARSVLTLGYRVEVHGLNEVPADGPAILAANHSGWLDGPMLLNATKRPMRVLAKHELWNSHFGPLMRAGRAIPVDWKHADRNALKLSLQALREQELVGLFPEGTRCRGNLDWMRDGISYLLSFEPVPVIPVAIFGTRPTGESKNYIPPLGSKIHVVLGQAIAPEILVQPGDVTKRSTSLAIGEKLRPLLAAHVQSSAERFGLSLPLDDVSDREDHER